MIIRELNMALSRLSPRWRLQQLDLALSTFCLCHRFNHQVARVCRLISRTGDGPWYLLLALVLLRWEPVHGAAFLPRCCWHLPSSCRCTGC
ncbi:hypothetical protein PCI56_20500 [Plesiomonas shigelloides subsp. oncorhynchi]|nr:hypothetical protein [Plesiomonas shigelloides]